MTAAEIGDNLSATIAFVALVVVVGVVRIVAHLKGH